MTFFGDWSEIKFVYLNRILHWLFIASGVKRNLHECKVYGVGFDDEEVNIFTNILICKCDSFPFKYLGLPVGSNMKLSKN